MTLSACIQSFRLRTLPLSMSGIILGGGLAYHYLTANQTFCLTHYCLVFFLALLTTLSLQILSNLSNELGDADHGTDDGQDARVAYGLQSGAITYKEMKMLIRLFVGLCIVFGTALVWTAFGTLLSVRSVVFLGLGLLAIIGSMTYTLGKYNYGYRGFGDLGVFLFFGLLSTMGSFYLQTYTLTTDALLSAVAIALPIVGVLNLNNIRDMDNDRAHGKHTFAGWLGKKGGKIYHTCLIVCSLVIFTCLWHYLTLLALPVLIWHLIYIWRHEDGMLDRQMPVLMFTSIALAILAAIM